jgi:hypothetical protein
VEGRTTNAARRSRAIAKAERMARFLQSTRSPLVRQAAAVPLRGRHSAAPAGSCRRFRPRPRQQQLMQLPVRRRANLIGRCVRWQASQTLGLMPSPACGRTGLPASVAITAHVPVARAVPGSIVGLPRPVIEFITATLSRNIEPGPSLRNLGLRTIRYWHIR